ncbi:type II secretion system minor pseudopilin GspJ [Pseudomaricurvus alkylphenolicus]|uniref:type II secretion system minor pseudopilin GspJ n=1 Tax=Pseudomaricurvus alkylphenolicus TaxID=1306991 RepID=UPI001422EC21|nr:type II secretion system minor pseudopilin GspJ [Pseudomaricurvus alkylphenolicus]NIB44469.1 type II secretion system minor pseudopilin GspJ [Pseudomaricurvus alkylphenolicus]
MNGAISHPPPRGFTLLEVMIALSIFAIMGVAAYQLLSGELRTQQALEDISGRRDDWQRGMLRLSNDLRQLTDRSIRDDYGEQEYALQGSSDQMSLTRNGWPNPLERQRSNLQRIHYRLSEDDQGNPFLGRLYWHSLDRAPGVEPITQKLLPGVENISIRYFDEETREWHSQWPPANFGFGGGQTYQLPQAVEITLDTLDQGQITRLITRSGHART